MENEQENQQEVSLSELEARAKAASDKKTKTPEEPKEEAQTQSAQSTELVPVEELAVMPKNAGGRPKNAVSKDDLSDKDIQIMALLACGMDKTAVANIAGIDRKQLYKLLDQERVQRFTEGARKRLSSLAPLAVEILHSELVKGNVDVAQALLKGLNLMRSSVNSKPGTERERSIAEEVIDSQGKTTRRVIRERERELTDDGE